MNIIQQYNMHKDAQKEISAVTGKGRCCVVGDKKGYSLQTANYNITTVWFMNKRKYVANVQPINSNKKTVISGDRARDLYFSLYGKFFSVAR